MNCDIVSEHFGIAMSENEATEFLKKVESYKQNELFGKSEQLEQLAEENTKQIVCSWYDYCKDCMNENYRRIKNMCHPAKWATQAYIDGYREAEKNEIHILESMEIKRLVKENEELKEKLYSCEKNENTNINIKK